MRTNTIFKKVYEDIKKELQNKNNTFMKTYVIPSINYNSDNRNTKELYFASEIENEIKTLLDNFDNKVSFESYKDTYYFSNDEKLLKQYISNQIDLENEEMEF